MFCLERGKQRKRGFTPLRHPVVTGIVFERGRSPLSLKLPSPARNNSGLLHNIGWRGVRGEVTLFNHMQTEPAGNNIDKYS
jgi:hypothetical protein